MTKSIRFNIVSFLIIFISISSLIGCASKKNNLINNDEQIDKATITDVPNVPPLSEKNGEETKDNDVKTTEPNAEKLPLKESENKKPNGSVIQKPQDDDSRPKPDYINKIVYYAKYSDLYHYDKECPNIKKGSEIFSGKLGEVIKLGHKIPCKICVPQY